MTGEWARKSIGVHHGVAAHEYGQGDPVLMLHGIGGCANAFAGITQRLQSAGYRAIAWDAPGYGCSADPPKPPGVDGYARIAVDLLSALHACPAHLVGVSWGGVIATWIAARSPDYVRSLTLVDSTRGSAVEATKSEAMLRRVRELEEVGPSIFARRRARKLVAPDADASTVAEIEQQMSTVRLQGYRCAAEMMAETNTETLLGEIAVPTLVLVGEHDRVTGVPESQLLASSIPGAEFGVIPRAGHAAPQERPDDVAAAILSFLGSSTANIDNASWS